MGPCRNCELPLFRLTLGVGLWSRATLDFKDAPKPTIPAVIPAATFPIPNDPVLNFSGVIDPRSLPLKLSLSPSKGVSSEVPLCLRRLLKNHNMNATNPIRTMPPITPPTIEPAEARECDTINGSGVAVGSEVGSGNCELIDPLEDGNPFWLLKGFDGRGVDAALILDVEVGGEVGVDSVDVVDVDESVVGVEEVSAVEEVLAATEEVVDGGGA